MPSNDARQRHYLRQLAAKSEHQKHIDLALLQQYLTSIRVKGKSQLAPAIARTTTLH